MLKLLHTRRKSRNQGHPKEIKLDKCTTIWRLEKWGKNFVRTQRDHQGHPKELLTFMEY